MKVALYMCGHGPYREPRFIEMQYLRLLRYRSALKDKLEENIDIEGIYIDINFPRTDCIKELKELCTLLKNIKEEKVKTVLVDICVGESFFEYKYENIIWQLENSGAKVYNCFYDDEDASLSVLVNKFGKKVHSYLLPSDREEFITLFPALASEVAYEVFEDRLSKIPAGNEDPFITYVFRKIRSLSEENPYRCSKLPWLSHKKIHELHELEKEELEERRLVEETYILAPDQKGKLLEEDVCILRDQDGFNWVTNRLKELGFRYIVNGKEHSFIMEYDRFILYADPRQEGAINVLMYKKNEEKKTRQKGYSYPIETFRILDSWKNNLKGKLISRIEGVIKKNP